MVKYRELNFCNKTIVVKERKDADTDMNDINRFGLLNALLSVINNFDEEDSKVIIAKYFLKNIDRIEEINIYDAADECFVARSSIRRFAKYIGFNNFRNLKQDHESYHYYKDLDEITDNYPTILADQIATMVHEASKKINNEIEKIVEYIDECSEIVFLVSDIYSSRCLDFQKEMIFLGKMVRIISYNFSDNKILMNSSSDTLLMIISVSGGFMKEIEGFTKQLICKKVVITSKVTPAVLDSYDLVLSIGNMQQPASRTIYHTYGVEYYLDIIRHEFRKKIGKQ